MSYMNVKLIPITEEQEAQLREVATIVSCVLRLTGRDEIRECGRVLDNILYNLAGASYQQVEVAVKDEVETVSQGA